MARTPVERAIAARGGPLSSLARAVDADVHQGFPGAWRWRTVVALPDRYAWSIETTGEPDHYLFDGQVVRAFVGNRLVSEDPSPQAPLRSHARFMAVVGLDALRLPGVAVEPLASGELPPGASWGLAATWGDDGTRYRVGFDERGLLVWAAGPVSLPPFGTSQLEATFDDFRRVDGRWIPHHVRWVADGAPLADERVLAACPDGEREASVFVEPARLPSCAPGDAR